MPEDEFLAVYLCIVEKFRKISIISSTKIMISQKFEVLIAWKWLPSQIFEA